MRRPRWWPRWSPPKKPDPPPADLYSRVTLLQQLTFSFVSPIVRFGLYQPLQQADLLPVAEADRAATVTAALEKEWAVERTKRRPSLNKALFRTRRGMFYLTGFMFATEVTIMLVKPIVLHSLLVWLNGAGTSNDWRHGSGIALGLAALDFLLLFVHHAGFYLTIREGWRVRTSVQGLLYNKILRLDSRWQSSVSTGQIVSTIANDAQRYEECAASFHFTWLSPIMALAGAGLLVMYVGVIPATVGCLASVGLIPLQVWCGNQVGKTRRVTASITDKRVGRMNEVLAGIQSVKAFGWSRPFRESIAAAREEERRSLSWTMVMRATTLGIFFFGPSLAAFFTFVTYWALGNTLELPAVFAAMTLLQTLRECARWIPRSIEQASEAAVATSRIQPLLLLPEVALGGSRDGECGDGTQTMEEAAPSAEVVVSVRDSDFSWCGSAQPHHSPDTKTSAVPSPALHLRGLSLDVKPGELLVVAGPVGAGKSTLLDAILGEVACVRGPGVRLRPQTRLGYCSQQAWIQSGTVRDNIVFGGGTKPFDEARYARALEACALDHDLRHLEDGDMTEIGELGVNLSGGQRARVALARAVYADSELYLLDDVLSAVDARVSKHLFHACIRGALKDKAVVLVTHQIQYLPYASKVCLLDKSGGMVTACAPWELLQMSVPDWKGFVKEKAVAEEAEQEEEEEEEELDSTKQGDTVDDSSSGGSDKVLERTPILPLPTLVRGAGKGGNTTTVYVAAEDRVEGGVHGATYLSYLRSGGLPTGVGIILLLLVSQAILALADFWLKIWASSSNQDKGGDYYPRVYAIIMCVCVVLGLLRAHLFFRFALRASSHLHDKALEAVLAAPLTFFHSNPRGRILNKFSKDLDAADDLLPYAMFDFLQSAGLCLAAVVVGCIAVPWLLLIVAPLLVFFRTYRREFVASAREVKRLDGISRSPMYAMVSTSLQGGKIIRAFRAEDAMQQRFLRKLDENGKCAYLFIVLSRYLGYRLDMLCACFLTMLCVLAAVLHRSLDPGLLGLSLTYALMLSGTFQWAIRQSAQTETLLTSVERLHHYTTLLPEEAEDEGRRVDDDDEAVYRRLSPNWPNQGEVVVRNLHVRYREDLPIVLRNVTFVLPAGRKIGIVGRTGSGKSSFLAALLRLNQIVDGDIVLDGVSLPQLKRADARKAVSWIPQNPDLFSGTLRQNLDPFLRYSDAELWVALEDVHLKGSVPSLDMPVTEGGGNLSMGTRQLLSLARAVLLRRKVLLMDEATANVDFVMDQRIQATLRTAPAFRGCTLVVIAHRINTVLDSDVVLVFADGQCVEQGSPAELLARPNSLFNDMVQEAQGSSQTRARPEIDVQ